jgi:hypothetical protein
MNKTIWALAFVVLACGTAFAIGNATVTPGTQSKYAGIANTGNVTTEGGNVSGVNVNSTTSTEKWAGFYGNVSGNIVLAEAGQSVFLYTWTANQSNGEVCVSTAANPSWATLGAGVASIVDTVWSYASADTDSAVNTFKTTEDYAIQNQTITGAASATTGMGSFETGIINTTSPAATQDNLAFCVKSNAAGLNYRNQSANFELIVPTGQGATDTEQYFFFVELV